MQPKVAIIYLTYPTKNWERDINRCLATLERMSYPKDRVELICVESKGKIEPVQPWFEKTWMPKSGKELPPITYIFRDEWIGFSGNNNLGFAKAKELGCDYVYLLNEDTDTDPDFLTKAVERAEQDPKVAIVQSLILLGETRDKVNTVGNAFHFLGFGYSKGYQWTREQALVFLQKDQETNPDLAIGYASGAGMLVRVAALDDRSLFDEKFFSYHEDTDASLQVRIRGWKVVVEPSSVIYHYYEFAKAKINYYWMERNRYVLLFSYYRGLTLALLFPMLMVMDLAILVFSIKNGWWEEKVKVYNEWLDRSFWQWIRERRKTIRWSRAIPDRELLAQAVATIEFQEDSVKNPVLDEIGNPIMQAYWAVVKRLI